MSCSSFGTFKRTLFKVRYIWESKKQSEKCETYLPILLVLATVYRKRTSVPKDPFPFPGWLNSSAHKTLQLLSMLCLAYRLSMLPLLSTATAVYPLDRPDGRGVDSELS